MREIRSMNLDASMEAPGQTTAMRSGRATPRGHQHGRDRVYAAVAALLVIRSGVTVAAHFAKGAPLIDRIISLIATPPFKADLHQMCCIACRMHPRLPET